jgi:hypothetical protein
MKRFLTALVALCISSTAWGAAGKLYSASCPSHPTFCDSNGSNLGQVTMATTAPGTDCASQTVTVYINDGLSTLTYGTNWTGTTEVAACRSLATAIAAVSGIDSAACNESSYVINIQPSRGRVQFWNLASSAAACATVSTVTQGSVAIGNTRIFNAGDGSLSFTKMDGLAPATVNAYISASGTTVDFTRAHEPAIFAKATGAIKTAANAQQDFFWVQPWNGGQRFYFELAQGVGSLGANTQLASLGLTPSATGWLLTLDNTATDSLEITEGIVAGSAHSYLVGTDSARCQAVFYIPTRANLTNLGFGLRKLAAYETASTAAEMLAAYDDKAMIGIGTNAGVLKTFTSVGGSDTATSLTHAAAANADMLALEVDMTVGRAVTYKVGTSTPAGTSFAQFQTALTAALASLAADASAVAYSFTSALTVVPSIIIAASGAGAPDTTLVYYNCTK